MDAGREVAQLVDRGLGVGERAVDQLAARSPGRLSKCSRASWSSIISATSRCWAPSWRSRPRRRRSASPASTSRARDARSAWSRARSSTSRRSFSIASAAAAAASKADRGLGQRRRVDERADAPALVVDLGERRALAAATRVARRGRRSRPRAASTRRRATGRPARRRARRARPGRREPLDHARRPWPCGRSECAPARAGRRPGTSAKRAMNASCAAFGGARRRAA